MQDLSNRASREGYEAGRAQALTEVAGVIREEIELYKHYTPEQKGKINALNIVLEYCTTRVRR